LKQTTLFSRVATHFMTSTWRQN